MGGSPTVGFGAWGFDAPCGGFEGMGAAGVNYAFGVRGDAAGGRLYMGGFDLLPLGEGGVLGRGG